MPVFAALIGRPDGAARLAEALRLIGLDGHGAPPDDCAACTWAAGRRAAAPGDDVALLVLWLPDETDGAAQLALHANPDEFLDSLAPATAAACLCPRHQPLARRERAARLTRCGAPRRPPPCAVLQTWRTRRSRLNTVGPVQRLTDEQVRRLIMATVAGVPGGATEAWIARVLDWATGVLIEDSLLQAVLRGHLLVDASGDELAFVATARGERELDPQMRAALGLSRTTMADA